jgi:hypothetical protein
MAEGSAGTRSWFRRRRAASTRSFRFRSTIWSLARRRSAGARVVGSPVVGGDGEDPVELDGRGIGRHEVVVRGRVDEVLPVPLDDLELGQEEVGRSRWSLLHLTGEEGGDVVEAVRLGGRE